MRRLSVLLFILLLGFYANAHDTIALFKPVAMLEGQPPVEKTYLHLAKTKDGKASFEYTDSSIKGNYRLVIEGIGDDGNLGRMVYKYIIK